MRGKVRGARRAHNAEVQPRFIARAVALLGLMLGVEVTRSNTGAVRITIEPAARRELHQAGLGAVIATARSARERVSSIHAVVGDAC